MKPFRTLMTLVSFAFVFLLPNRAFSQATIEQILTNGPTAKRINIVIFSEGYTSSELAKFPEDARKVLDHLLESPPYSEYRGYFNAFIISVPSAQSGSDHPSRSISQDTYFNSTYDSYGTQRLVTIPPNDRDFDYNNGQGKVDALLQQLMPEYDIVMIIVNDLEYGGSGGQTAITSVNASSAEILVHELGHSFANLGDEYAGSFTGSGSETPNTTHETQRESIKWRNWILNSTPIPTPQTLQYANVVGLFEGAAYQATGWYRPKLDCKMRTLDRPFCQVCSEALVLSEYKFIRPIDAFSPANLTVAITDAQPVALSVSPLLPASHNLSIQWFVNLTPVAGATSLVFNVSSLILGAGSFKVKAEVRDTTMLVRNDPSNLLTDSAVWTVNVTAGPPTIRLLTPTRLADGRFRFNLSETTASRSVIQGSTDFANWISIFTNNSGAALEFTDPESLNLNRRFYRVLLGQ